MVCRRYRLTLWKLPRELRLRTASAEFDISFDRGNNAESTLSLTGKALYKNYYYHYYYYYYVALPMLTHVRGISITMFDMF